MSNTLAIATVTGILESRLMALMNTAGLTGFGVFADHPGSTADPGVYIKLTRVVPSAALRNADLPTRRGDGTAVTRPRLAVTLHYLFSFVGEKSTFDSERLAGLVMTDLHAVPTLTPTAIEEYLTGLPENHVLKNADLADQLDRVRLTLTPFDEDRLAKSWGLFNQSFYGLTVAYEAGAVLLDAEIRTRPPLPVASAGLFVFPAGIPRITKVRSSAIDQPVVTLGQDLIIEGTNLRGPTTWLRVAGQLLPVANEEIGVDRITFPLTSSLGLPAGVTSVEIVHQVDVDNDSTATDLRPGATSNAAPFALLPVIASGAPPVTAVVGGHDIRLTVTPPPASSQDVALLMDRSGGTGHAASAVWRQEGGVIVFTVEGLTPGTWLVRVRINGATSGLRADASGLYAEPAVVLS